MASFEEHEVNGFLDVEEQETASVRTLARQGKGWRMRHLLAAVAGAATLGTCGVVLSRQSKPQTTRLTARSLFESPAVHEVATDNVMNIKAHLPRAQKNRAEVRALVEKTFKDLSDKMQEKTPDLYERLEKIELTQEHHDGVVHMMRYLRDPRVIKMGLDTAKAIQEGAKDGDEAVDEATMKRRIINKLQPHAGDVRNMLREVYDNAHMFAASDEGSGFKSVLQKHKLGTFKTMKGAYYDEFTARAPLVAERQLQTYPAVPASANPGVAANLAQAAQMQQHSWVQHVPHPFQVAEEVLGIIGTAVAEADTMIRIINPIEKIFPGGHDLEIPPVLTTAIGGADWLFQSVDCEMDGVADGYNPVEMLGCPLMAGSAGFDMMREPLTLVGILGDNNPSNGRQGNHAGGHAHQGVFDDTAAGKEMEKEDEGVFPWCMFWGMHTCKKPGSHSSDSGS